MPMHMRRDTRPGCICPHIEISLVAVFATCTWPVTSSMIQRNIRPTTSVGMIQGSRIQNGGHMFFKDDYHVDFGLRLGVVESHDEIVFPYYFYLDLPR